MKSVSRQRIGKHVPAATNAHRTIELPLETVFSAWSLQSLGDPVRGEREVCVYGRLG
jgi:hypothetical protein